MSKPEINSQNSNGQTKPPDYFKCEWDVPKFCNLSEIQTSAGDIYQDPKYLSLLPDFGFFKVIK
jgi:hypothetical protein